MPRAKLSPVPQEWLENVPQSCQYRGEKAKRSQMLALQRSLFARAMSKQTTTAEVNACAKTFALLEVALNGNGKREVESTTNGEPEAKPKRTAGLKSKLLSSAVQPTAASGSNEVQNQPDTQSSQATDDTSEA